MTDASQFADDRFSAASSRSLSPDQGISFVDRFDVSFCAFLDLFVCLCVFSAIVCSLLTVLFPC